MADKTGPFQSESANKAVAGVGAILIVVGTLMLEQKWFSDPAVNVWIGRAIAALGTIGTVLGIGWNKLPMIRKETKE